MATFPADWPEIEIIPIAAPIAPVSDDAMYASMSLVLLTPLSRGNVTIASTDTSLNPLVNPNWLLSSTDRQMVVQIVKRARQIAASAGFTYGPEFLPGPAVETDAQILAFVQETMGTIWHASGTCKI